MSFLRKIYLWFYHFIILLLSYIPSKRYLHYDLIIVRVDALGDYVIWHDALATYQERFKGLRVLFICTDLVAPLAKQETFFTEVFSFNRSRLLSETCLFGRVIKEMRRISSDMIIYPLWQRDPLGDMLIAHIKSPQKIGIRTKDGDLLWNKFCKHNYSQLIPITDCKSEIKSIEKFTQEVVSTSYQYGHNPLLLRNSSSVKIDGSYIVLSFSTSNERKEWEIEKFIEVINTIPAYFKIFLTGAGERDIIKAEIIIKSVNDNGRVVNMVNKTTVVNLVDLISKANFVIGNDSAAVHIAAATRVKSVCILLGAHFGRFLPYPEDLPFKEYIPRIVCHKMECYNCNYRCVKGNSVPFECVKRISTEKVIEIVRCLCVN